MIQLNELTEWSGVFDCGKLAKWNKDRGTINGNDLKIRGETSLINWRSVAGKDETAHFPAHITSDGRMEV